MRRHPIFASIMKILYSAECCQTLNYGLVTRYKQAVFDLVCSILFVYTIQFLQFRVSVYGSNVGRNIVCFERHYFLAIYNS